MKSTHVFKYFLIFFVFIFVFPIRIYALDLDTSSMFVDETYSKTISMDFRSANLNDVLKIFSQQSGMNFIAETNIASSKVNLYFENVPVEEALERILSANNLTYEIKPGSNIFVVKSRTVPEKMLTSRVYALQHATLPSSNLVNTISDTTNIAASGNGLLAALNNLLSSRGSLIEDPRTNSIIISDYPSQFSEIEKTIERLDVKVPMILIEAEILDVSEGALDSIGAKFGNTPLTVAGPGKAILWPFDTDNANADAEKTDWLDTDEDGFDDTLVRDIKRTIAIDYTEGSLDFSNELLTLQFLKTHSETKNLARPRILTLNNQTASIEIMTDEVVGVNFESSDSGGSTAVTPERTTTGVSLKVTPQANIKTGEIKLAIIPTSIQTKLSSLSTTAQSYQDPETQTTKSVFRVQDGDTVIIGGLIRTKSSSAKTKVPLLADIPLLGRAFKHSSDTESQRELIVFITPSILQDKKNSDIPNIEPVQENFINIIREQTPPSNLSSNKNDKISFMNKQGF